MSGECFGCGGQGGECHCKDNLKVHFSSGKDDWETPDDFFAEQNRIYDFILDLAADEINHKCPRWYGPGGEVEDALMVDWRPLLHEGNLWLNPPYSRKLQKLFITKAKNAASAVDRRTVAKYNSIVCLLPARTDTKLFHEVIRPHALSIDFLKGRLKFKGAEHGAPFPSMIVVF